MSEKSQRLHYIDNIRILISILVILHHLAVTYGGPGNWYYRDPVTEDLATIVLTVLILINHSFFMGFFFFIAGYFMPGSLIRKGSKRFLFDRILRLGIPTAIYVFVINPLIFAFLFFSGHELSTTYVTALLRRYPTVLIGLGPMWFALNLLLASIPFVFVFKFFSGKLRTKLVFGSGLTASIVLAVFLGLITFMIHIWVPTRYLLPVIRLRLTSVPQYAVFLSLGILAGYYGWKGGFPPQLIRFWRWALVPLLLGFGVLFAVSYPDKMALLHQGLHWQTFAYVMWEQLFAVGLTLVLLDTFQKYLHHDTPLLRWAAENTYTVYIIHPLVIVVLARSFESATMHPLLKFVLLALIAIPVCFGLSHLIRKLPFTKRVL